MPSSREDVFAAALSKLSPFGVSFVDFLLSVHEVVYIDLGSTRIES